MGHHVSTCGLSGHPILDGDRVVVMVFEKNQTHRTGQSLGRIYDATEEIAPTSFPLRGKMDDYGRFTPDEKTRRSFACEQLLATYPYEDTDTLQEAIWKGEVKRNQTTTRRVSSRIAGEKPIIAGLWVAHEAVFDYVVDQVSDARSRSAGAFATLPGLLEQLKTWSDKTQVKYKDIPREELSDDERIALHQARALYWTLFMDGCFPEQIPLEQALDYDGLNNARHTCAFFRARPDNQCIHEGLAELLGDQLQTLFEQDDAARHEYLTRLAPEAAMMMALAANLYILRKPYQITGAFGTQDAWDCMREISKFNAFLHGRAEGVCQELYEEEY